MRFNGNKADLSPPDGYVEVYLGPDAFSSSLPVIGHAPLAPTYTSPGRISPTPGGVPVMIT
ncbi:MAG: hypothetical protein ACUVSI_12305, partial [Actinomycetota bacterium]